MKARGLCAGVILAAGRSSRLGRPKALLELAGEAIVDRLARVFREAGLDPVIVVGAGEVLSRAGTIEGDPRQPMIDSLARALPHLGDAAGAIVQPVDAPFTTVEIIRALLAAHEGRSVVPMYGGTPGHPVLLTASSFARVAERPAGGLRTVLGAEPAATLDWDDERILADLDTPEDVARWLDGV